MTHSHLLETITDKVHRDAYGPNYIHHKSLRGKLITVACALNFFEFVNILIADRAANEGIIVSSTFDKKDEPLSCSQLRLPELASIRFVIDETMDSFTFKITSH